MHFLDSSSLVKAYWLEQGTPAVQQILDGDGVVAISRLAHVELSAALTRRGRSTENTPADVLSALNAFDRDFRAIFTIVELTPRLLSEAAGLARRHGLRGADAIQLACAMNARSTQPLNLPFYFVCNDAELNRAAFAEHLTLSTPS
jgi:uncharacterized protein